MHAGETPKHWIALVAQPAWQFKPPVQPHLAPASVHKTQSVAMVDPSAVVYRLRPQGVHLLVVPEPDVE
jgi:hypothetical protein